MRPALLLGLGTGGGNAVRDIRGNLEVVAADTVWEPKSRGGPDLILGPQTCRGLGCGGKPDRGRAAALESIHVVRDLLADRPVVIVVASLGGGTGSGALPVVLDAARDKRVPTAAVASTPFHFEGRVRSRQAAASIDESRASGHLLLSVSATELLASFGADVPLSSGFSILNGVLGTCALDLLEQASGHRGHTFADVPQSTVRHARALTGAHLGELVDEFKRQSLLKRDAQESLIIRPTGLEMLSRLATDRSVLREVSPRMFEELVATLYDAAGLKVKLTSASRDHGADVLVWTPATLFGREVLTTVQVKKYDPARLVGEGAIRDLRGAQFLFNADRAECITTSDFSGPARSAATALDIDLAAYDELREKILSVLADRSAT